jgi:hypothetical protein
MASMNHILIVFVSLLLIITITTNLVLASSSSSSSGSSPSFVEIAPVDNNLADAAGSDRMIRPTFPEHWGPPPKIQTRDYVQLPGDYGRGSGTLRNWILKKMEEDEQGEQQQAAGASSSSAAAAEAALGEFEEGEAANRSSQPASWPEKDMVGWNGEVAKAAILAEQSSLHVYIVPQNSMLTMDYSEERVRILVDENGKVVRQPRIG